MRIISVNSVGAIPLWHSVLLIKYNRPNETHICITSAHIVFIYSIAETSITIPGISYVVDTGRQKCRNYHAGTGECFRFETM